MFHYGDVRSIQSSEAKDYITFDVGGTSFAVHISRLELLMEEMEQISKNIEARKRLGRDF